jgi:hypothetical protein
MRGRHPLSIVCRRSGIPVMALQGSVAGGEERPLYHLRYSLDQDLAVLLKQVCHVPEKWRHLQHG